MSTYVAVPLHDKELTAKVEEELRKYDKSVQILPFYSTSQFSQIAPTDRLGLMVLGSNVRIDDWDMKAPRAVEKLRLHQRQIPIYVVTANTAREYLGELKGNGVNGVLDVNGHFSRELRDAFHLHLPRQN